MGAERVKHGLTRVKDEAIDFASDLRQGSTALVRVARDSASTVKRVIRAELDTSIKGPVLLIPEYVKALTTIEKGKGQAKIGFPTALGSITVENVLMRLPSNEPIVMAAISATAVGAAFGFLGVKGILNILDGNVQRINAELKQKDLELQAKLKQRQQKVEEKQKKGSPGILYHLDGSKIETMVST